MDDDLNTTAKAMAREAAERLFVWVKSTDLEIPAQVNFDIGIIIGRLFTLEKL